MNNLFIILIYDALIRLVRADMKDKILSIAIMAILLTSTIAAVMPIKQSYAAVTIETSTDKFFGPSLVRVLITDPAKTNNGDSINVHVEAKHGATSLGTANVAVDAIGTSGQFELYIAAHTNANPANPTQSPDPDNNPDADIDGEFSIVRIYAGASTGSNNIKGIASNLQDGDKIVITYGGQTKEISFESTTADLSVDRTVAGDKNKITLRLNDPDANTDPTAIDKFETKYDTTDILTSTLAIDTTASGQDLDDDTTDPSGNEANVVWVETGQNTGIFELTVSIDSADDSNNIAELTSVTFPSTVTFTVTDHDVYDKDDADNKGVAPYNDAKSTSSTDSVDVSLRNSDGLIELVNPLTIANGFQIKITDSDRNIDTSTKDSFSNKVDLTVGSNTATLSVAFKETGDNTGVFVPDITDNKIEIVPVTSLPGGGTVLVSDQIEVKDNKLYITADGLKNDHDITITYNDDAADPSGTDKFSIVEKIQHFAGKISTETPSVSINGKARIVIEDKDLNTNPNSKENYIVTFSTSNSATEDNSADFKGLANLILKVRNQGVDFSGNNLVISFEETEPNSGKFVGEVDIQKINDVLDPNNKLSDGDRIKFEYTDNTEDPEITRSVDVSIGKPPISIELDRNSYPPSHNTASHSDNDVGDVEVPRNTILHVNITDNSMNKNPSSVETLTLDSNNFFMELLDSTDFKINPGSNVDANDNTKKVMKVTGTGFAQFAPIPTSAKETGPDTGVFEFKITLPAKVGDTIIDDDYQIKITYKSGSDETSTTASIVSTTATLTTDMLTYSLGNTIILTINEPDWNSDSKEKDALNADLSAIFIDARKDGTLADVVAASGGNMDLDPDQIEETGPNTGVFEIKIKSINEEFVERGSKITFELEDPTTTGAGGSETIKHTVNIISGQPEIIFDKDVYTPFDEVCISIVDPSANTDPDKKDDLNKVTVKVGKFEDTFTKAGGGNKFTETGPNTGIFMFKEDECIRLDASKWTSGKNSDPNDGIIPAARDKAVSVTYETTTGDIELSKSALIVFNDGSISFDKSSYKVGDKAKITVIDPDLNEDPDVQDTIKIDVWSTTDRGGVSITLRETGDKTGIFTGEVILTKDVSSGTRLQVNDGDTITARYIDRTLPDPADYDPETDATKTRDIQRLDATATIGISKLPTERAPASEPKLVDESGNPITEITAGKQVLISGKVTNNQTISQDFVQIVKVTDEFGNVVMLAFTQGTLNPNEERTNAFSWIPEKPGTYTVEILVWQSFANPIPLSPKVTTTVEVM